MAANFRSTATNETLIARAKFLKQIRKCFDDAGFIEVQPPVIGSDFVIDRHIDPIEIQLQNPATKLPQTWYLQSSPEAAMKRILVGGLPAIYSLGPVFRRDEFGQRHNPEFTMLEWYCRGQDFATACNFLDRLVQQMLQRPAARQFRFTDAFFAATQIQLFTASLDDFADIAKANNLAVDRDYSNDWDDWVNLLFSEVLQPKLGYDQPTIVTHFPASQAALARIDPDDLRVAERFELFIDGLELANGYCELLDADELRLRCEAENQLRQHDGKRKLPLPEKLLAAMQVGLPAMSGCAAGLDRWLMIALQKSSIAEVLCYPIDQA